MVARALRFNRVCSYHRNALVKAAGGEDVAKMVIACSRWILTWESNT